MWEIQCNTVCDGWVNVSTDERGQPERFLTKKAAEAELMSHLHAMRDAVACGDMQDYDPVDWRVHEA